MKNRREKSLRHVNISTYHNSNIGLEIIFYNCALPDDGILRLETYKTFIN